MAASSEALPQLRPAVLGFNVDGVAAAKTTKWLSQVIEAQHDDEGQENQTSLGIGPEGHARWAGSPDHTGRRHPVLDRHAIGGS
jgi:hypothetical protein